MPNVTISTASVAEGTCPAWIIALWPQLVSLLSANLNGSLNVFNYGNSTPAPADQDKPWIRTDSAGRIDKVYNYSGGAWVALHPDFPGKVVMWRGDITAIDTLDGGETAAITATTGPMWARLTEMDAKFPLGIGTLPGGTVVAVDSTGGEENHSLIATEMPPHTHDIAILPSVDFGSGSSTMRRLDTSGNFNDVTSTRSTGGQGTPPTVVAHNNMPPWRGIGFIYRTARTHYRI